VIGGGSAEGGAVERQIYQLPGFLNQYGGQDENAWRTRIARAFPKAAAIGACPC
jgi:hypothetical protein